MSDPIEDREDSNMLRDLYGRNYLGNPTLEAVCKRFELALNRLEDEDQEKTDLLDQVDFLQRELSVAERKLDQALEDLARLHKRRSDQEAKDLGRVLDRMNAVIL